MDISHDSRRRRSALACNTCRARRTKCDGQRPKCSFCVERRRDCYYQELQDLSLSPQDLELLKIWEQLERISTLVQGQLRQRTPSPKAQQLSCSVSNCDAPVEFPIMVLQNTAFISLLGLERNLLVLLESQERAGLGISQPPCPPAVMIDPHYASLLLGAYMDHIHIWYPILHADYTEDFFHAITSCFPPLVSSCIALVVLAVGYVAKCGTIKDTVQGRPDTMYIQAAMAMLPAVFAESSPRSAQCLLLFGTYHLCCARPYQAHDYVVMASNRLQSYLINEYGTADDTTEVSIFQSCFWSALLIESEIRVQLDLVDSGIRSVASYAPVLASSVTWTGYQPRPFESSPDCTLAPSDDGSDLAYFVAEIAMRKMLPRCTYAISTPSPGVHIYAPIVAAELERQLDEWLQILPESLSFQSSRSYIDSSWRNSARAEFLQTQYYAFKASIYWPAVYEVLRTGAANDALRHPCSSFFTSYAEFATSAAAAVTVCKPNAWTLYASMFTISMATLAALEEPCLSEFIALGRVSQGLTLVVEMLARVADVSPSLGEMSTRLAERVAQSRIGAIEKLATYSV
ncbi:hypothetical protein BDW69DRAFT_195976 [Aspergillus filifer]